MRFIILLSLYISILFLVPMLMTWVNTAIPNSFWGDVYMPAGVNSIQNGINPDWDWGARHYWYFWLCIFLWLLSLVRIIIWVDWYWSYNNKKSY